MSTNPLLATVQQRLMLKRLQAALGGRYAANVPIRIGTIVSTTQVAVNGTLYDMDSSNLGLEPGQKLNVKNVQRLGCARYVPADAWGGAGKGGAGTGIAKHDIIGPYHFVQGPEGLFVGISPDDTLALLDPNDWVRLWIGREEGPRLGLRKLDNDDGTQTLAFEVISSPNVSVIGFSTKDYLTNSARLILGHPESPKRIELEAPTAWDTDPDTTPDEVRGMTVPLQCLAELITAGYIDLDDLATHFHFPVYTLANLPDARGFAPGQPVCIVSPGDSSLLAFTWRDNLDNWMWPPVGAGYMSPHTHTSEETGGVLGTAATNLDAILTDDDGNILVDNTGNVLTGA